MFANGIWIVVPTIIMLQTLSEMGDIYNNKSTSLKKKHN